MSTVAVTGLGGRALSGIKWGSVSVVTMVVFQLGLMAVMARLLAPADFGLMAMAGVAMRLFAFFAQWGIGAALVQRAEIGEREVRLAVGLTLALCVPATALTVALAPLVGAFFGNDTVSRIVQVLAAGFVLNGMGAVSMALLRRSLRFKAVAAVETLSYLIGYGAVGLVCAWIGLGVWALVAATLGQAAFAWIAAWACTHHPLRPVWRGDRSFLLGYGVRHSVISFVEFVGTTLDTAVLGRLVGDAALGLYNRASLLAVLPAEKVAGVVSRMLFPVFSAAQQDRATVGAAWLLGLGVVGLAAGVLALGMAAAAEEVIGVLLGPAWLEAVPVFKILALATPFMYMSNVCGVTCDALALLRFKLRLQTSALLLLGLLFALWYRHGFTGIAWAIVVTEVLRLAVYLRVLGRALECRVADVARTLAVVVGGTALVALAVAAAASLLRATGPAGLVLFCETLAGSAALILGLVLAARTMGPTPAGALAGRHIPGAARLLAWAAGSR